MLEIVGKLLKIPVFFVCIHYVCFSFLLQNDSALFAGMEKAPTEWLFIAI